MKLLRKLNMYKNYYLYKPLYKKKYYKNLKKKKIILNYQNKLGEGLNRIVYYHPKDRNKCIKICKNKKKKWNNNCQDFRFFQLNKNNKMIAKYYEVVNTNLGLGIVFQIIRDYDNKMSLTINEFKKKNINVSEDFKKEFIKELEKNKYKFFRKYKIYPSGYDNICIKFLNKDNYIFVVIDDYHDIEPKI